MVVTDDGATGMHALKRPGSLGDSWCAAVVFFAAFAVALWFVRTYPLLPPKNDAAEYIRIARNVSIGNGVSLDGIHPYAYRPPLFPVLLGGWFSATGEASPASAAVFQSILHGLSAGMAFLLFRAMYCPLPWAVVLSLVVAFQPMLFTRTVFVLQENTLVFITTAALWATVLWFRFGTAGWAVAAGAAWGVATLGKSVTLFLPLLVSACWVLDRGFRLRVPFRHVLVFGVCFAAVLLPWTIRNYRYFHRMVPVNDQVAGMLEWNVRHAVPSGSPSGESFVKELDRQGIRGEQRRKALWGYVRAHWRYFLVERTLRNAKNFASPARDWWWSRGRYGPGEARPWYWTIHDYGLRFLYLFLLYRFFSWARGRLSPASGFVAAFCLVYWAEYAIVLGAPRFSLPIFPALLALLVPSRHPASVRTAWTATP